MTARRSRAAAAARAKPSDAGERPRRSAIGLVVLAAGGSTRMGRSKQALAYRADRDSARPESLLRHAARAAVESGMRPVVVVLGAEAETLAPQIADLPVHVVAHAEWNRGIGSSLKAGVESVTALAPALDAIIITVCDQPHLSSAVLTRLGRAYRGSDAMVVASAYGDTAGVPALFDRSVFAELRALGDRDGARRLIALDPDRTLTVPFPLGAVDLDTPEEYAAYVAGERRTAR